MFVATVGDGRPLVVVHGWRLDHTVEQADLEPVLADARGWRRHYVDLPGMGESPPLDDDANLRDYVAALRETVNDLVGSHRYALAGTSAGALLALSLASGDDRVAALMLRVPLIEPDARRRRLPTGAEAALRPSTAVRRAEKIAQVWAPAERRVHPAVTALRADPSRYALDLVCERLDIPALVLVGRQDTRVGWRDQTVLLDWLPHATFSVIDDAEHEFPWGSDDGVFSALVHDWLQRAAEALK